MNSNWAVLAYLVVWGVAIDAAAVLASTEVVLRLYALLVGRLAGSVCGRLIFRP